MDASSLIKPKILSSESYQALLVGQYGSRDYLFRDVQEESLHELFLLSDTARVQHVSDIMVHVPKPDPAYFLHTGTLDIIADKIRDDAINLVIIDVNLKPTQLKNLEEYLKVRVLGRVELILDIFAMRAKTKEAALQVELAQLTYILPRLKGLGGVLSRLGGGIGTRGPGETMLEADRRHIRRRILTLKKELESVSKHRENTRKNRTPLSFAIVGYTNAGKTSLLNILSSSSKNLLAEDRLFATLDSYTRKVYLGEYEYKPLYATATDTVGFIRNLPLNLAAAFKSTLEEIAHVDSIVLVADASSVRVFEEIEVVKSEIKKLGIDENSIMIFFNKDDIILKINKKDIQQKYPDAIWGNTMSKDGVKNLRNKMYEMAVVVSLQKTGKSL
ncbi:MAG: GTPase HflX [Spirochaetia bacterium]|nr:GTPase HflX [Spirochaetia bacterium]